MALSFRRNLLTPSATIRSASISKPESVSSSKSKVLKIFKDSVPFGLAAYNAGPQRMKLFALARNEVMSQIQKPTSEPKDEIWFDELPWFETSFYVKAILRNSILYKLSDMKSEASSHENEIKFESLLWKDLVR